MTPAGFPHSDILGSTSARDSPKLFAACHVLHRLLAPRHPPRALCSLTPFQRLTRRSEAEMPATLAAPDVGGPGYTLNNSAKSKFFNLPKQYPIGKVRPLPGSRRAGTRPTAVPAILLVGELRDRRS